MTLMRSLAKVKNVRLAAVCDVWDKHLADATKIALVQSVIAFKNGDFYHRDQTTANRAYAGTSIDQDSASRSPLYADEVGTGNGTLGSLFTLISTTMPEDNPGSLKAQQYADVLAYFLRLNKFPAGQVELKGSADAMKGLKLDKK